MDTLVLYDARDGAEPPPLAREVADVSGMLLDGNHALRGVELGDSMFVVLFLSRAWAEQSAAMAQALRRNAKRVVIVPQGGEPGPELRQIAAMVVDPAGGAKGVRAALKASKIPASSGEAAGERRGLPLLSIFAVGAFVLLVALVAVFGFTDSWAPKPGKSAATPAATSTDPPAAPAPKAEEAKGEDLERFGPAGARLRSFTEPAKADEPAPTAPAPAPKAESPSAPAQSKAERRPPEPAPSPSDPAQ